jgi:hypothetical protein
MTRRNLILIGIGALLACSLPMLAADAETPQMTVHQSAGFAISAPVREIALTPNPPRWGFEEMERPRFVPKPRLTGRVIDRVEQNNVTPGLNYSLGTSFLGLGAGYPGYTIHAAPPDTNMAVGATQIVEWINSQFIIFDKNGNTLAGPIDGNRIWQNLGGECFNNNDGDPIAQYDKAHQRWLLAQNVFHLTTGEAPPYFACVAVSTSSDATGTYNLYQFSLDDEFPDYPKWGIWTNGYYQSQNDFVPRGGSYLHPKICAYNDAKLRVGDPSAEQICFTLSAGDGGIQPADLDSRVGPPAGQDEFFFAIWDNNNLSEYSMHPDYANPNNSTVTGNNGSQLLPVTSFIAACNNTFGGACVPQLGGELLDVLGFDMMYRIAYSDDSPPLHATATPPLPAPVQHWLLLHDAESAGGFESPRWYELTANQHAIPVTGVHVAQSGTYNPDNNHRWMGSIARDKKYNILLGFSKSSSSTHPSIQVAGRSIGDPLGTLGPEVQIVQGTGSQVNTANRWGDYSAMRLDPTDSCTFWYIAEYYMMTAQFDWSTQIASIKFSNCQ